MTKAEKRADWLNWFKLSVAQARDARLDGDTAKACRLDGTIERYYSEAADYGFTEDDLFPIESDVRNRSDR